MSAPSSRFTSSILNQVVTSVAAAVFGTMTFSPVAAEPDGTNQPITIGDTLTYCGAQPAGAVAYVLNGTNCPATCTTSPETCTATVPAVAVASLPVATYPVTGSFAGDANYTSASAASGTFSITDELTKTTLGASSTPLTFT